MEASSSRNQSEASGAPTAEVPADPDKLYGHWSCLGDPDEEGKPTALIIFSGRPREGDLRDHLLKLGWVVCCIDTAATTPANLLDDGLWNCVKREISIGLYDAIWIATPCGTFSPLREKPPGPKPLRSLEHPAGLPKSQLTQSEQKQVKEANILVDRSAEAAEAATQKGLPWGLENPDHGDGRLSIWVMPKIAKLRSGSDVTEVNFDQCRTGLSTTKPTKLLLHKLNLSELDGKRCNHPVREFIRADGSTYKSAHESTVQRWVTGPTGKRERASRAQGEYTSEFSKAIAMAINQKAGKSWRKGQLSREPLP